MTPPEPPTAEPPVEAPRVSIRSLVILALADAPEARVSRAWLRAQLPPGRSITAGPDTGRARRGSMARGDSVTDRLRVVLQEMERSGLLRRETDDVVILNWTALRDAARRLRGSPRRQLVAA